MRANWGSNGTKTGPNPRCRCGIELLGRTAARWSGKRDDRDWRVFAWYNEGCCSINSIERYRLGRGDPGDGTDHRRDAESLENMPARFTLAGRPNHFTVTMNRSQPNSPGDFDLEAIARLAIEGATIR